MVTESEFNSAVPDISEWAIVRMGNDEIDACRLMLSAMIKIYATTRPLEDWQSLENWIVDSVRQGFNYYRKLKAH